MGGGVQRLGNSQGPSRPITFTDRKECASDLTSSTIDWLMRRYSAAVLPRVHQNLLGLCCNSLSPLGEKTPLCSGISRMPKGAPVNDPTLWLVIGIVLSDSPSLQQLASCAAVPSTFGALRNGTSHGSCNEGLLILVDAVLDLVVNALVKLAADGRVFSIQPIIGLLRPRSSRNSIL